MLPAGSLSAQLLGSSGPEITVYNDRVRRFLADHPSLTEVAAGYVLAHELAHVMQGIARHSDAGILKARLSREDYKEMTIHKLAFTSSDVVLIHGASEVTSPIARNGCRRRHPLELVRQPKRPEPDRGRFLSRATVICRCYFCSRQYLPRTPVTRV